MRSMTGFSRERINIFDQLCVVSIRSVNSKNLDIYLKLPDQWLHIDQEVRKLVGQFFQRGKVTIIFEMIQDSSKLDITINEEILKTLCVYQEAIKTHFPQAQEPSFIDILRYLSVHAKVDKTENRSLNKDIEKQLKEIFADQLRDRQAEGDILSRFFIESADKMTESLVRVKERVPSIREAYEKKLKDKCLEIVDIVHQSRILTEVAILCEKADISEEIVRLEKHLNHLKEVIDTKDVCGKKVDFILQESLREVNTIGSKSSDYDTVKEVLSMKEEIDKMREQVCNVE